MKYPAVGSIAKDNACSFCVWAPLRKRLDLIIVDSNKRHSLEKDEDGYWSARIEDVTAGTEYLFQMDDGKKLPDPASRAQLQGVHGPSSVVDTIYPWRDEQWKGLPLGEMIIYELHVGTFTSRGDFEGVISRLPYLRDLGVNAVELMPVAQFPGTRNWGYDGVFPFAVQDSYGGVKGLKKLVDEAHQIGIAVILDVVYNHQGPEGNYLGEYGPYFTDKYKTGWGQALNFDDAWCDGVRHFYWQNALMWLDEFHIDGLRLDAVHAIWDFSARHFIEELSSRVQALEVKSGRKKVLIAEFDLNNPRYISPPSMGGYGLSGQWIDEFHHALHSLVTGEVDGYYEDFGDTGHLASALKDSYVYTGQYSKHRKKLFGKSPAGTTYDQFVVFAQNHDQTGNRMLGDRISTLVSFEGLKLAAAVYLLSPHVPMLFMGEEYGEKNPFQYFISHTDEKLVELVRKGRREEFAYFKWQGEVPDPQAEKTFEQCILSWEKSKESETLFSFYKHLIAFKKDRPAMQSRNRESLEIISTDNEVVCFERKHNNDRLLFMLNFNKTTVSVSPPIQHSLKKIFDSSSQQWGGEGLPDGEPLKPGTPVKLNAQSVLIFEY